MSSEQKNYTLYGVEASYYAAKIRCYLLQKPLPFTEIQTDRKVFEDLIVPRIGYPIVPVLVTPQGETLQDTAHMIEQLEATHPDDPMVPTTPRRRLATYLMEFYADEWLKLPALYYRWHYDYEFAHTMMGYNNDPHASPEEQRRVGAKVAARFKTWPRHLGAVETTYAAVEAHFYELLDLLDRHFTAHPYLLGNARCVADCALMGPMYAHLYRDPYSGAIVRERAPSLCAWIARMREASSSTVAIGNDHDELPATLLPVFQVLSRDFVPVLCTAMPLLQAWLGSHRGEPIPRYVGKHRYTLGIGTDYAAQGFRAIHPFEQWKWQRVRAIFDAGSPVERESMESLLRELGAHELLKLEMPNRLARENYRLVYEASAR